MAKVSIYAQGDIPQPDQKTVFGWLKKDNMKSENMWHAIRYHDDLIRELMARQDRQGKWIMFLLLAWLFSVVTLAVLMVR